MRRAGFWLRWSWRDLRRRWVLVGAIAIVLAIGTGLYSGLGSIENWRKDSNDASFAFLNAHDLEIGLTEGSLARPGELRALAESIPAAGSIARAEERLAVPTQVEIERPGDDPLLASAELVGTDLREPDPIDGYSADQGRDLGPADEGESTALLETLYGTLHDLPPEGALRVAGGERLDYVGLGTSPEYFLVTRPGGGDFGGSEASFAVIFTSLATAQRLAGGEPAVNDVVISLREGADAAVVQAQLEDVVARSGLGADVTVLDDEPAHRILYQDAEGDQQLFNIFALLILAGASFAAFNLATRIVEAQRREIGVGMALGVPPRELAIRPLLLGAEIAFAGVVFGLLFGLAMGAIFRGALEDLLPLPVMRTPFEPEVFVRGAIIGFLLPFAATAIPVWRGLRVTPIEAIRVGFRSAKSSGLASVGKRLHLPGSALAQMPLRNLLRAPRRTALTVLGIGAVVTVVVAFVGMIDSFLATVDDSERETAGDVPERIIVSLDGFHAEDSALVEQVRSSPLVASSAPTLTLPGKLATGEDDFDALIGTVDRADPIWRPSTAAGPGLEEEPDGILISEKAAEDLGVGVGDEVELTHPQGLAGGVVGEATTPIRVAGLHPNPFRSYAYVDSGRAAEMGLAGQANSIDVLPAEGASEDDVKRALFGLRGVAGVERATASSEFVRERITDFVGIFRIVELFALVLAILIAFNSTSINIDERARENATMQAFGVPVSGVVTLSVVEAALVGLLGTVVGLGLGALVLQWVLKVTLPNTLPDLGVNASITLGSLGIAALVGIAASVLAPLLTARRLRRMDIPSTLRVVE
ncbi:MAG: ABC transporter permease [Solirubrobacterales bacterium]